MRQWYAAVYKSAAARLGVGINIATRRELPFVLITARSRVTRLRTSIPSPLPLAPAEVALALGHLSPHSSESHAYGRVLGDVGSWRMEHFRLQLAYAIVINSVRLGIRERRGRSGTRRPFVIEAIWLSPRIVSRDIVRPPEARSRVHTYTYCIHRDSNGFSAWSGYVTNALVDIWYHYRRYRFYLRIRICICFAWFRLNRRVASEWSAWNYRGIIRFFHSSRVVRWYIRHGLAGYKRANVASRSMRSTIRYCSFGVICVSRGVKCVCGTTRLDGRYHRRLRAISRGFPD